MARKYEYMVVRSYGPECCCRGQGDLEEAFEDGYEYVHSSDFIEGKSGKSGYIEYILRREVVDEPIVDI